jgi:proteasome lid subunit RPN8/RPN11
MICCVPRPSSNLWISPEIRSTIASHSAATYPQECCGVLVGTDEAGARTVFQAIPVDNVWPVVDERVRRFSIDPKTLLTIDRSLDGTGRSVIGFYHSHPDHPAEPSEFDRSIAWPTYSYVIARVGASGIEAIRSWRLIGDANAFVEEVIEDV